MPSRIRSHGVMRWSISSRVLSRRAQTDECVPAPSSTQAEIPRNEQDDDDKADDVNDLIHDWTPRVSHQVDCSPEWRLTLAAPEWRPRRLYHLSAHTCSLCGGVHGGLGLLLTTSGLSVQVGRITEVAWRRSDNAYRRTSFAVASASSSRLESMMANQTWAANGHPGVKDSNRCLWKALHKQRYAQYAVMNSSWAWSGSRPRSPWADCHEGVVGLDISSWLAHGWRSHNWRSPWTWSAQCTR